MKLLAVSSFLFLVTISSIHAQFIEFGGGIGAYSYAGDLSRGYKPLDSRFGVYGIYRLNLSEFVSFRTSLGIGSLQGDDSDPIDPLAEERQRSFKTNLLEFSGVIEYYFLDFKSDKASIKWSPFVFGGFGLTRFGEIEGAPEDQDFNRIQAHLPFGLGFKHLIGRRFAIAAEFGVRRTFTDMLDGVADSEQTRKDGFNFGQPNTNDWYFFSGISVTYILYKIPCPFPYVPNKTLLKRRVK